MGISQLSRGITLEFFHILIVAVVPIVDRILGKRDNDWSFFVKTSQFLFSHTIAVVADVVAAVAMAFNEIEP
jgi:hypothetical protein